ncbi:MAG: tetratricopeptide repeat protein [Acidobacteriia bacterium]|nr:tetratricopeptide repeat protein [Terriglobia bacterium]
MPDGAPNSAARWSAVAIAIAAAIWFSYAGVKHAVASHYAGSTSADDWLHAAQVEPADAEHWYQLGRFRQLDFEHTDLTLALTYYRRAVELNPYSPFYKLDLAGTLEMSGQYAEADKYFQAAQHDYPISPEVSWKYGNFLLRQQRLTEAYDEIHRAVMVDPKLIPLAVSRAWRSDPDVHVLLDQILPDTPTADWGAIAYLSDSQEPVAGLAVWSRLIAKKPAVEWKTVFPFLDMLVAQERYDDAGQVWRQALSLAGDSASAQEARSLVFDGGFEKDLSGGGFGWQETDVAGANFDIDSDIKHSGERSARIVFDGSENLAYNNLYQQVLVTPGTRYRFQGYLRTEQISTDSGVRFEIYDPRDQKSLDILTPNEHGTQPWTLEEADFITGAQTHLIRVRVFRAPSARLDNKISGTAWVDDVAIFTGGPKP